MAELREWQVPSADKHAASLSKGNFSLDTSSTGTGKTYIACDVARRLDRPFLVICPKVARTAWQRVADDMGAGSLFLEAVNPQRLLYKNDWFYGNTWHLDPGSWIIWDELHLGCSGPDSKTTRALALTKVHRIKVLGMSATVADSPLKMRGVGFLAGLHDFNKASFHRWCMEHGCFKPRYRNGWDFPKGPAGVKHMLKVHESMAGIMVRIRRDEVPGFPATSIGSSLIDLDPELTSEVNKEYTALTHERSNDLAEMLRVRQLTELYKVPAILDLVKDGIEEGQSVVVFLNFTEPRLKLSALLNKAGIKHGQIYGAQNDRERQGFIDAFQDNRIHAMLIMSQAGGASLSLHDVKHERPRISYLCPSYNAVEMQQCLGRIDRDGGTKTVQTFLLAANTLEEKIHRVIQRKSSRIATLNDGDLIP